MRYSLFLPLLLVVGGCSFLGDDPGGGIDCDRANTVTADRRFSEDSFQIGCGSALLHEGTLGMTFGEGFWPFGNGGNQDGFRADIDEPGLMITIPDAEAGRTYDVLAREPEMSMMYWLDEGFSDRAFDFNCEPYRSNSLYTATITIDELTDARASGRFVADFDCGGVRVDLINGQFSVEL